MSPPRRRRREPYPWEFCPGHCAQCGRVCGTTICSNCRHDKGRHHPVGMVVRWNGEKVHPWEFHQPRLGRCRP